MVPIASRLAVRPEVTTPTPYHLPDLAAVLLSGALFAAIAEELVFRGLAYAPLYRRLGRVGAAIATGTMWALAHHYDYSVYGSEGLITLRCTAPLGILYAEIYRRHQSLVPTIVFHGVQNAAGIVLEERFVPHLVAFSGTVLVIFFISMIVFPRCRRSSMVAGHAEP